MGCSLFSKALFGALAVVGFICLLLIGSLQESGANSTTHSTANLKLADALVREKFIDHPELDLNYMSKRRVPNGPDPIHNSLERVKRGTQRFKWLGELGILYDLLDNHKYQDLRSFNESSEKVQKMTQNVYSHFALI